jgi:hypothetical protein
MQRAFEKLRGIVLLGVASAACWTTLCLALVGVLAVFRPTDFDAGEGPIQIGAILARVGLVSGLCFALALALAIVERRRAVHDLSHARAALCGVAGSAAFPLATGRADQVLVMCPIGAVVAVVLVALARRAAQRGSLEPARAASGCAARALALVRGAIGPARRS